LRTIHGHLHGIHKAVDNFKDLGHGHPAFLLGETVQPPQDSLNLAFSEQLLCEFLCAILSYYTP